MASWKATARAAIVASLAAWVGCRSTPKDLEPSPLSRAVPIAAAADDARAPKQAAVATGASTPETRDRKAIAIAIEKEAWILAAPSASAERIGYMRAGGRVKRASEPVSKDGCAGGWFEIEPRGYVCLDAAWTADPDHPIARLYERQPARDGLPWLYVRSRYPTPRFYSRLPTRKEQRSLEPKLDEWLRKYARLERKEGFVELPRADPTPVMLTRGGALPGWEGKDRGVDLDLGRAKRHSGFAVLATYDHDGRRFGLTSDLALTPLDRAAVVEPSALRGARLSKDLDLPIAIVKAKKAKEFDKEGTHGFAVERWSVIPLSGKKFEKGGRAFLRTVDDESVRADQVVEITRYKVAPVWAERGDKWIDVSILKQTLVAYEGLKPVFATLVSTGADGIAAHEGSHATIQGTFLIHTKHLTTTMNSDEQGSAFDLRDVPFVQYFSAGYALHAAYWHDDFGAPRSHGCVNLSPSDAAWLFAWTTPDVPEGWHGAQTAEGTLVHIHP